LLLLRLDLEEVELEAEVELPGVERPQVIKS
jgi:hypothetical protein